MENLTPTDLIKLAKTGNKTAFDRLFRMFYVKLRNYSFLITKDINASEDVVQEIFYNLWTKPELVQNINSPEAYLRVAVYNRSVGFLKEKNKQNLTQLNHQYIDWQDLHMEILEYRRDLLTEKELANAITKAVEKLPEQCRLVFKLSRNFGFKNLEIADHMGITIKGVEKHITKALHHLRIELKEFLSVILILFLIK